MAPNPTRTFLLSPANSGGARAGLLMRAEARFPLALRLQARDGAPIGELYAFMSGLYFRGKLAYATAFARPPGSVRVIVPGLGLIPPDAPITLPELRAIARVPVDLADSGYRTALARDARALAAELPPGCEVVLLGSIASDKYVSVLAEAFGERLRFPAEFVGRGDMSRGGLMLRQVEAASELTYVRLGDVARHGARPPKLPPLRRALSR